MKTNNMNKVMNPNIIEEMRANGYYINIDDVKEAYQSINDNECVHPFLLDENRKSIRKKGYSAYLCLECLKHVELTSKEARIRHTIYNNKNRKFIIDAYKKFREAYGEDIDYYDYEAIFQDIISEDYQNIRENKKSR